MVLRRTVGDKMNRPHQPLCHRIVPAADDASLVGSWCHQGCRSYLTDYSIGGNDLTPVGTTRSELHNAYWGDGNSDYLYAAVADYRGSDSVGTVECWFRLDTLGAARQLFGIQDEASNTRFFGFQVQATNELCVVQRDDDVADSICGNTAVVAGEWNQAILVSTGTAWILYLNGAAETPTIVGGTNSGDWFAETSATDNITIGAYLILAGSGYYFDGEIAACNVYSETKSPQWAAARYQSAVPEDDLVLSVRGDGQDASRYMDDLDPVGAPIMGHRIVGNGTTDYLYRSEADWRSSDSAGTIALWFRTLASNDYMFSSTDEAATTRYIAIASTGGNLTITQRNDDVADTISGDTAINDGVWHHGVVVSTGTAYIFYLDGEAEELTVAGGANTGDWFAETTSRNNVVVGAIVSLAGSTGYFNGALDDVRVYSDVKSAEWAAIDYINTRSAY